MNNWLFASDNNAGVCREIMEAILQANADSAIAYGDDIYTSKINKVYSDIFETETFVFSTATGTAANALGLAIITPSFGETVCHRSAHILTTEAGAPEFYGGGSRLVPVNGDHGKISIEDLLLTIEARQRPSKHAMACSSISITQPTEAGTLYTLSEVATVGEVARSRGLKLHMDGARFANAIAALGCTPASLTWRAGVDVLSLGTTKNGSMNAEAVIVFDPDLAKTIAIRQKRAGLLTSKMRFVSAQLIAYVTDGLWLRNADYANSAASKLSAILSPSPSINFVHPVQTNQIFVDIAPEMLRYLSARDIQLRPWDWRRPSIVRLVTSYADDPPKIDAVSERLREALHHASAIVGN